METFSYGVGVAGEKSSYSKYTIKYSLWKTLPADMLFKAMCNVLVLEMGHLLTVVDGMLRANVKNQAVVVTYSYFHKKRNVSFEKPFFSAIF
jgi:hypothetical protein